MKKSISFTLKFSGDELEKLEQKSSKFLKNHGYPNNTVQTQTTILRELISSGRKIGNQKASGIDMCVYWQIEKKSIILEIKKLVSETTCDRLMELDRTIQWIRACQDPFESYLARLPKASEALQVAETVGSGLAKIAHETDAIIDFYVGENNILKLSAVSNLSY
jgi:hypothetical protein